MKHGRKLLAALMAIAMLSVMCVPTVSATSVRQVTVVLDGETVDFVDTYARIIHDYAYVPIAKIIQILTGESPYWDDVTRMASFNFRGDVFKIFINQKGIYVNDEFSEFDTGPEIADDRTMVPLRMLTNALGFEALWDGSTSTVTLISPPEPPPMAVVINAVPSSIAIKPGETVEAVVSATNIATSVKIVDEEDNIVVESGLFTADGIQNIFTMSFEPTKGGVYRAYAATAEGYNRNGFKEIAIEMEGSPIIDMSISSVNAAPGETVSITIHTTNDISRVKLISDLNATDVIEAASFTTIDDHRVFKLDWNIRSDYYPVGTSVTAKIYAGTQEAYLGTYSTAKVDVVSGARIFEAHISPAEVNVNSTGAIAITTDTSVSSVSFTITSGGGSMRDNRLTGYIESNGRRRWETVYYAGGTAGSTVVSVSAAPDSGQPASAQVTINVKNVANDSRIHDMYVRPSQIAAGTQATTTVTTGIDVQRVSCYSNFDQRVVDASGGTVSGNIKTWTYDFIVPDYAGGQVCTITAAAYNSSGSQTDSNNTQFTVMPTVNPLDEIIHDVSIEPQAGITSGTRVIFTIATGLDVTGVTLFNDLSEDLIEINSGTVNGDRKIWAHEFIVPDNWGGRSCIFTLDVYNNANRTDSDEYEIFIDAYAES